MSTYQDLNESFEALLGSTSRFVPMAFHVHSPGSYDWGTRPNAEAARNAKARFNGDAGVQQFLNELASEFTIVCITDHMKLDYACKLAHASLGRSDIRVFPGLEVNCVIPPALSQRIHLLAIFPPEKDVIAIERIFAQRGNFPTDANRTGNEEFPIDSLQAWAKTVQEQGGMLIVAHIDDPNRGHRACFRALREDSVRMFVTDANQNIIEDQREISEEYRGHIATSGVHAIEIMKPEDRQHYVAVTGRDGKPVRIPCVVRSDAHCIEDFSKAEKKTFVKVARLDFASVRDALKFHETRIKFKDDLPTGTSPRIVGMRLRSPSGNGLFREAMLAFNQNLNCIIGPRGSGKSTVIEALRYALCCNKVLEEVASHDKTQGSFRDVALGIQRANLQDTIIEVIFETRSRTRHCLSATYDPKSDIVTEVLDLAGDQRPVAEEQLPREYPVRIYSWSEIENLGRQPELQRALLDRLVERLPEYGEKRTLFYSQLVENRLLIENVCQKLTSKLEEDRGMLRSFSQYKYDFERINTPEVAGLFEELDASRERLSVLRSVQDKLLDLRRSIQSVSNVSFPTLIEEILGEKSEAVRSWWETEISGRLRLLEIGDAIAALASQANSRIEEKLNSIGALITSENGKISQSETVLRERTQTSPEEELVRGKREQSKRRFDAASAKRTEYNTLLAGLDGLLQRRVEIVAEIDSLQDAIAGARSASRDALQVSLGRFAAPGMHVTVAFEAGRDRAKVIEFLRDKGFLTQPPFGQYKRNQLAERCAQMASPTRIARAILTQTPAVLNEEGIAIETPGALRQDEADLLLSHFFPFRKDEDADVRAVNSDKLMQVLKLQEQPWDDQLRILLNERPVDELSPGQRSSAMLPLIALSETVPLIIDQPEDNLDNRMVGNTLTKILADLKEHRQIVVATHNPNIVVSGDAEQVIVLNAPDARRATVTRSGCIDEPAIIDSVLSILEGGKEAFLARERRYQEHLT
jgi:ABC-type cobalamin/Fe3+-siderophores transport system ATPase subunit